MGLVCRVVEHQSKNRAVNKAAQQSKALCDTCLRGEVCHDVHPSGAVRLHSIQTSLLVLARMPLPFMAGDATVIGTVSLVGAYLSGEGRLA